VVGPLLSNGSPERAVEDSSTWCQRGSSSWSILPDMAITQRWKRGTNAGEGPHPTGGEPSEPDPAEVSQTAPKRVRQDRRRRGRPSLSIRDAWPVLLVRAAHPKQGVVTALALGAAAAIAGRPAREVAVVLATVLVGQTILGWHNDLVDRRRDARHQVPGKPIGEGKLDPGTAWFALACAVLVVVPLSIATGVTAGSCYLLSLATGMLGNVVLRHGVLSWLTWVIAFALYPAYLSYGGWGGTAEGSAPTVGLTVLAGLLGLGVHFLRSIWGLVADNEDGWTYLPLKLGLRLGATKLLALTSSYIVLVLAAMGVVASSVGLST
jgi:4-hydroxybenzoate polyprenyltransferase